MKATDLSAHAWRRAFALGTWLSIASGVWAQGIPGYPDDVKSLDRREVAMLPRYCAYTQMFRESVPGGDNLSARAEWESILGPTFVHMHHYCLGLMKTNRAVLLSRDAVARRFYLGDAIMEFDYVITRAPADFVLLPEILTKKAQNLALLGKGPQAVLEFRRAIDAKNDYWSAYAYLSDYYVEAGDPKKAMEVLKEGLSRVPTASALQRRVNDLDQTKRRKP